VGWDVHDGFRHIQYSTNVLNLQGVYEFFKISHVREEEVDGITGSQVEMTNKRLEKYYPESKFGGFSDIDGTIVFYNRVNALINKNDTILDIGCGRGKFTEDSNLYQRNLRMIKGKVKQVIGIDVDINSEGNPTLDIFKKIDINNPWPIENNSIDLAFCYQVLEHIDNPDLLFSECNRVLKKNGYLCIRTTNKWGYIGLGARIIPHSFHKRILHHIQNNRKDEDIFPTFFKCNTIPAIRRMLNKYNFNGVVYGYNSEPGYFDNSYLWYSTMKLYLSICPQILKTSLFVFARKNK